MIRLTALLVAVMAIVVTMTNDKSEHVAPAELATDTPVPAVVSETPTVTAELNTQQLQQAPQPIEPTQDSLRVVHGDGVTIREYARSDSASHLRRMVNVASNDAPADAQIHRVAIASDQNTVSTDGDAAVWQISGNSVNLREGPSTGTAVITSLRRGTEVEVIAHHGDWAHLQVLDSEQSGFLVASFLQETN